MKSGGVACLVWMLHVTHVDGPMIPSRNTREYAEVRLGMGPDCWQKWSTDLTRIANGEGANKGETRVRPPDREVAISDGRVPPRASERAAFYKTSQVERSW